MNFPLAPLPSYDYHHLYSVFQGAPKRVAIPDPLFCQSLYFFLGPSLHSLLSWFPGFYLALPLGMWYLSEHVCVFTHACVHVCACLCVYACMSMHMRVCKSVCVHVCLCAYACLSVCMYARLYACVCVV